MLVLVLVLVVVMLVIVVVMLVVVTYLVVGEVREDKVEPQLQTCAFNETRFAVIQNVQSHLFARGREKENQGRGDGAVVLGAAAMRLRTRETTLQLYRLYHLYRHHYHHNLCNSNIATKNNKHQDVHLKS